MLSCDMHNLYKTVHTCYVAQSPQGDWYGSSLAPVSGCRRACGVGMYVKGCRNTLAQHAEKFDYLKVYR